jgi:hypothetical protein
MDDRIDGTYHYADLPEYVRSCFERAVFILWLFRVDKLSPFLKQFGNSFDDSSLDIVLFVD